MCECGYRRISGAALSCTQRSAPAGNCVVREKDLLPGQQFVGRVFAVPAASTDCYAYSFDTARVCGSDRAFPAGNVYDACETRAVSRDADGCAKLPGYTFFRGWTLRPEEATSWRVDDGTQWEKVAGGTAAKAAAARDMPLMAGRCSALGSCVAFVNNGNSTDLLYQLPARSHWQLTAPDAEYCTGIYAKEPPPDSCPRIPGYLFTPLHTLDANASITGSTSSSGGDSSSSSSSGGSFITIAGSGPCADCADSAGLALRCDAYGSACAGFSNYHGLIVSTGTTSSSGNTPALLTDAPLAQFTSTPCVGMFSRTGRAFPAEVEELDQLLCGQLVYCTGQLRYHATGAQASGGSGSGSSSPTSSGGGSSGSSYYVDIAVDVLTDYVMPRQLLGASGGGFKSLPAVRSLTVRCGGGSGLLGSGFPVGLAALLPFLRELRLSGCRLSGRLPDELASLKYLRVLDLSNNGLSGPLPESWANMTLGYLNLSRNALTGGLPLSWRRLITPPAAAPLPPPSPPPPRSPPEMAAAASMAASGIATGTPASTSTSTLATAAALLVADLSYNQLAGSVQHDFVYDSCVDGEMRMSLAGTTPPAALVDALGSGGRPTFLLHGNPAVAAWAGAYQYAAADVDALEGGGSNMCGADGYKVALGVLWGVFGALLLVVVGIAVYGAVRDARRHQHGGAGSGRLGFMSDHGRHRPHPFPPRASDHDGGTDTDDDGTVPNSPSAAHMDSPRRSPRGGAGAAGDDDDEDADDGVGARRGAVAVVSSSATASAAAAAAARCGARGRGLWATACGALARLWGKRWFRRLVLLARVAYLVADLGLDVAVTIWLYSDGASSSSAVCLAFIVITQGVIGIALLVSLSHHFFASRTLVLLLSPLLLVMMPVVGPVLAVANIRNSDVPLVFWRYLELVEFCVALLQAPAESVTQSVVYAQQNLMGNGMYMDHALFIASIIFSLGDMLIAAAKLCRYKRGPVRRVQVALTHLDKVRDPADYRTRLMADYGPHAGSGGALGRYDPTASHLAAPLTGGGGDGGAGSAAAARGGGAGGGSMFGLGGKGRQTGSDMFGLGPGGAPGGGGLLELQPAEGTGAESVGAATVAAAAVTAAAAAAVAAATTGSGGGSPPMGFTPMSSRFRPPSLLQPSASQRSGGGASSGGGVLTSTPSRLGAGQTPPGNTRLAPMTTPGQPSLKPLPSLPTTPGRPGGLVSAPATGSGAAPALPAGGDATAMWAGAGAAALAAEAAGASAGGSLERRSRSVPAEGGSVGGGPPLHAMAPLAGSFSADASLSAAGLPPHHHQHPPLMSSTSWAPMQTPPSMAARNRRTSGSAGGGSGSGVLPPPHPGQPTASATASSISLQASGLLATAASMAGAAAASTSTASASASPYQPQFATTYQNPHFATTYQNPHFAQSDSAEVRYLASAAASAAAALNDAASSDGSTGGAGSGSHQRLSTLSSAPAAPPRTGLAPQPGSSHGAGAGPIAGSSSIPEPASLGTASPPGTGGQGRWPGQSSTGGSPLGGSGGGGGGGGGPPRPSYGGTGAGTGSATPGSYGASGNVSGSMSPLRGVAAAAAADAATSSGSASPARRREGLLGLSIAVPPSPGSEAEVTVIRMHSLATTPEGATGGVRLLSPASASVPMSVSSQGGTPSVARSGPHPLFATSTVAGTSSAPVPAASALALAAATQQQQQQQQQHPEGSGRRASDFMSG
ncbi:hypothetical protein HYH02_012130 [Chlamydomonas schloesseri]|uniref:Uncharacterized protein n=1 Tax=Chlamydomonas schloesseri TaxID=2026947 RepID=A0A835SX53_9CHLO|nr:hypothetical protein HYH02_012130 [Chlamydomonas schloesseri]|eukprot:KAG2434932.1 hypothetical protein HYH02_012130 [Chlamydomonas schloesseri]